jgi:hypothetical protein
MQHSKSPNYPQTGGGKASLRLWVDALVCQAAVVFPQRSHQCASANLLGLTRTPRICLVKLGVEMREIDIEKGDDAMQLEGYLKAERLRRKSQEKATCTVDVTAYVSDLEMTETSELVFSMSSTLVTASSLGPLGV